MDIHELQPKTKDSQARKIGRGGKRGTYSGKGLKGQKARAGRKFKPIVRDLIKRYHKLRGYQFMRTHAKPKEVRIDVLEKKFESGDEVNPRVLLERHIISHEKGKTPRVKILDGGELSKKISVTGCSVSASAKKKIEGAGGTVQ